MRVKHPKMRHLFPRNNLIPRGRNGYHEQPFRHLFEVSSYSIIKNEKKLHSNKEEAIWMSGKKEGGKMLKLQNPATRKRLQTHHRERQKSDTEDLSTVSL